MTVKHGMDLLEAEGLIRRIPSKGTFLIREPTRTPRTLRQIGLIYPSSRALLHTSGYLLEIMQGIARAVPAGSDMHILSIHEDGLPDAAYLREWKLDGALLLGVENDDYLRSFSSWGIPGAVVDYCPRNAPVDFVACDNAAAARRVVEHLAALGHRRVACVSSYTRALVYGPHDKSTPLLIKESSDARERWEESLRALRESGLPAEELSLPAKPAEFAEAIARYAAGWRQRADQPTALLCDCDMVVPSLLQELQLCGLRVPEDLSVCAVGGSAEFARREQAGITCCHFDFAGMGRMAVEDLAGRCRQAEAAQPRGQRIGFTFVPGTTTGVMSATKGSMP
jgi:LacI family transcriptional regulator